MPAGAAQHFDLRPRVEEIQAKVLMLQCTMDKVFPANVESRRHLSRIPAPTRCIELDRPFGHMAAGVELTRWEAEMRWLLAP